MIRLSKRDNDVMEDKYDPEDFNSEYKTLFQNNFNAVNLTKELIAEGYKDISSITEQFKLRNYKVNEDVKKVMKAVLDKMEKDSSSEAK